MKMDNKKRYGMSMLDDRLAKHVLDYKCKNAYTTNIDALCAVNPYELFCQICPIHHLYSVLHL